MKSKWPACGTCGSHVAFKLGLALHSFDCVLLSMNDAWQTWDVLALPSDFQNARTLYATDDSAYEDTHGGTVRVLTTLIPTYESI